MDYLAVNNPLLFCGIFWNFHLLKQSHQKCLLRFWVQEVECNVRVFERLLEHIIEIVRIFNRPTYVDCRSYRMSKYMKMFCFLILLEINKYLLDQIFDLHHYENLKRIFK